MHCSRFFSYLIWRCSLLNSKKYMTTSFLFMLVLLPKSIVANSYSQQFSFITTNGYVDFPTARKCTSSLAATIPKTYKCKNPYAWNNICILLIIWSSDQSKKFDWICLKTEENILSNTNGKQLMLAVYIKYTHLICMFTRERDERKMFETRIFSVIIQPATLQMAFLLVVLFSFHSRLLLSCSIRTNSLKILHIEFEWFE